MVYGVIVLVTLLIYLLYRWGNRKSGENPTLKELEKYVNKTRKGRKK